MNVLFVRTLVAGQPLTLKNESSDDSDVKLRERQSFTQQKLSSLHTAGHVCMTWWVSTIVFCGTIFAAVWLQRDDLGRTTYVKWVLFGVLIAFFGGLAWFGHRVIHYLKDFENDLSGFAKSSAIKREVNLVLDTEVKFFTNGMRIGTRCAVVILIAWIIFGISLWGFNCCPPSPPPCVP